LITLFKNRNDTSQDLDELLAIDNLNQLRGEVKKLHKKVLQQVAQIKRLEFELEMEQGHVKILKHDNKLLRQMTVDMVNEISQNEGCIFILFI
jgi:hypothetical protein